MILYEKVVVPAKDSPDGESPVTLTLFECEIDSLFPKVYLFYLIDPFFGDTLIWEEHRSFTKKFEMIERAVEYAKGFKYQNSTK